MRYCVRHNFTHVVCFSQVDNYVQVIDPTVSCIEVSLRIHPAGCHLSLPVEFIALDFAAHGAEVVEIVYPVDKTHTLYRLTNFWPGCVTIAKGLLGIAEWVFTPYQFYRWLLENGGEVLTQEKQDALIDTLVGCHLTEEQRKNIFQQLRGSEIMGGDGKAAKQQKQLIEQQRQQLAQAQAEAQKNAAQIDSQNKAQEDLRRRKLLGRTSLIGTTELGVGGEKLG